MAIRIGNNGANTLNGTNSSDLILGLGGNDVINAGGGNDIVFAGDGNDQIFAGSGNDLVYAGTGNDSVFGGSGNDFLFGDAGNDVLDGGTGSDFVDGGSGSDTLIFTDAERGGQDRYVGGSGQDSLVLEFASARWSDPAVKAEVLAYLDYLAAGGTGNFTFTTMNLTVSSLETLVVKVDGIIVDPRAGGNTAPTGVADSYTTGENGVLTVSPATERGSLVDNDNTGSGAFTVELVNAPARGSLTLNADGTFSFNPGAAFDYLAAGQSAVETFTYRIVNSAGVSQPITVTLNINGANDIATISGTLSGVVSEDSGNGEAAISAGGRVIVADADSGQSGVANPGSFAGTYGTFVLQADGNWVYTLNNDLPSVQALGEGVSAVETFVVTSLDGSVSTPVSITIEGSNDIAVIAGDVNGAVQEDTTDPEVDSALIRTSGQVTVTDVDTGQSGVGNPGLFEGIYGSLELQADGSWVYTLNNDLASVQALGDGDSVSESFNVRSLDGSAVAPITITINGSNDAAEVTGDLEGFISEDQFSLETESLDLTITGQINVADVDTGESAMTAGQYTGLYGTLTLTANGAWSYTLNNDLPEVQALGFGVQVPDVFELTSIDGTPVTVTVTVQGNNDAAEFFGNLNGSVNEDGSSFENESGTLTATGQISTTDVDTGESGFAEIGEFEGLYGSLNLSEDGSWTYTLNNELESVQSLQSGEQVVEIINVRSLDGTVAEVVIEIEGVNDTAEISGDVAGLIQLAFEQFSTEGTVVVSDVDRDESAMVAVSYEGLYGNFEMQEDGDWTYVLNGNDPFDDGFPVNYETFEVQTVGGDVFVIDVAIFDDVLIPS